MTPRERLLGAITGRPIDRMPFSPFLAYYWEHLPVEEQAKGQFAYLKEMGADPLLRGVYHTTKFVYENCECTEKRNGPERCMIWETPVGTLTEISRYSPAGNTYYRTNHAVSTAEDFKVLQYIHEHLKVVETPQVLEADMARLGDEALILPLIGVEGKTAFQSLVERWVGTENLVYALYDEPEVVEECLAVMQARDEESVRLAVNSPADGFIFWEDSSTTNVSPSMFEKYTMPSINRWGEIIHQSGKLLIHHACGYIRDLLPLMAEMNIDAIESITPLPTGNVTMQQANQLLPEHIALIGGIDPVRLLNDTPEEVFAEARRLLHDLRNRRFVLANADSCPPGVAYEKLKGLADLVRENPA